MIWLESVVLRCRVCVPTATTTRSQRVSRRCCMACEHNQVSRHVRACSWGRGANPALGFDGSRLMIIAVLEMASAALFLVPKTRPFGLLLVSAFLGGAIAAHLGHGQPPAPPRGFSRVDLDGHVAEKRIHNYVAHRLGLGRRSCNSSRLRRGRIGLPASSMFTEHPLGCPICATTQNTRFTSLDALAIMRWSTTCRQDDTKSKLGRVEY
jgi:DoxX-like family